MRFSEVPFSFGRATIYPDTDDVWKNTLHTTRPDWLNIFIEFFDPKDFSIDKMGRTTTQLDQVIKPCRGSIIIAKKESWLQMYHKRLVAALYFLGDEVVGLSGNSNGECGERFYQIHCNTQATLLGLWSKQGISCETSNSIRITPPLAVRHTKLWKPYKIITSSKVYQYLSNMLVNSPENRLLTSCYHYFMAQSGDSMTHNFEKDYAHFCCCLESAFDIKEPQVYEQLREHVSSFYTTKDLDDILRGLYTCRSYYVHGLSDFSEQEEEKQRHKAYRIFNETKNTFSLVRSICYDILYYHVLKATMDERAHELLKSRPSNAICFVSKFLYSDEIYQDIVFHSKSKKSVDRISSYSGKDLEAFIVSSKRFQEEFDWSFLKKQPSPKDIVKTLRAYLAAYEKKMQRRAIKEQYIVLMVDIYDKNNGNPSVKDLWTCVVRGDLKANYNFDDPLADALVGIISQFAIWIKSIGTLEFP